MNELVKGLLERQEEERRTLAEKALAETIETLEILGCKDLLEIVEREVPNKTLEAKLERSLNNIEALKIKNKENVKALKAEHKEEVKTLKAEHKEAVKTLEANHKEEVKVLNKRIAELEKENKETNNSKELEEANKRIAELEEDNKRITELEELYAAEKKKAETLQSSNAKIRNKNKQLEDMIAELEADKIDMSSKEEVVQEVEEVVAPVAEIIEPKVEEVVEEVTQEVKELKIVENAKFKRDGVNLYEGDRHFIIAGKNAQEITLIPKSFEISITKEDTKKYQELLVKEYGFDKKRPKLSPYVVDIDNGLYKAHFCRVEATGGSIFNFSNTDVFSGYVMNQYCTFLWTWNPVVSDEPVVLYLSKVIKGEKAYVYSNSRETIAEIVKDMHEAYMERIKQVHGENAVSDFNNEATIAENTANALAFEKMVNDRYNAINDQIAAAAKNNSKESTDDSTKESIDNSKDILDEELENVDPDTLDFLADMF